MASFELDDWNLFGEVHVGVLSSDKLRHIIFRDFITVIVNLFYSATVMTASHTHDHASHLELLSRLITLNFPGISPFPYLWTSLQAPQYFYVSINNTEKNFPHHMFM